MLNVLLYIYIIIQQFVYYPECEINKVKNALQYIAMLCSHLFFKNKEGLGKSAISYV